MVVQKLEVMIKNIIIFWIGFVIIPSVHFLFLRNWSIDSSSASFDLKLSESLYNEELSEQMFSEIKILCLIMTNPANHQTKAVHIKNTWGRRCAKLLYISSQRDQELDTIVVNLTLESRNALRNKTRDGFLYVHDNYVDDFDWFIKADDDK